MKNMSYVVIDDEANSRELLKGLLETYFPAMKYRGMADNATSGIQLIGDVKPGIVFLDIEMPGADGFEMLDQVADANCKVVFVTGYDQYAIKAIKYSAADYLLKPVNITELQQAVARIMDRSTTTEKGMTDERHGIPMSAQNIILSHRKGKVLLALGDVIAIAAVDGCTYFHTVAGRKYLATYPLSYYEDRLTDDFFRVHKSTIINLAHVKAFGQGRMASVTMSDGSIFEIAARRKHEFYTLIRTH